MDKVKALSLLHWLIIAIGIILLGVAYFPYYKDPTSISFLQTSLVSIACSLFASTFISLLNDYYIKQKKIKYKAVDEWGIFDIDIRAKLNISINSYLDNMNKKMDITALGMSNFINAKGDFLEKKIKTGCEIRILTLNPDSQTIELKETFENVQKDSIKKSIADLIIWYERIKANPDNKGTITLKKYNSLVLDTYQNVDGNVFVGPHIPKKLSQQTIMYHFKKDSKGSEYFQNIFEKLWNDDEFTKDI
jgi:Domain of unknown function (DUF5919)